MRSIYELTMPGDVEGRSSRTVGYFSSLGLAVQVGQSGAGNASMGPSEGRVREVRVYETLLEAAVEIKDPRLDAALTPRDREDVIKARALARLTPEERRALGV